MTQCQPVMTKWGPVLAGQNVFGRTAHRGEPTGYLKTPCKLKLNLETRLTISDLGQNTYVPAFKITK